jgi:hypothetical protein
MAERMWPGLRQPRTERPVGAHVTQGGVEALALTSATPGASVGYRYDRDPAGRWRLYVDPVAVPAGLEIEAKAVRYGWAESESVRLR